MNVVMNNSNNDVPSNLVQVQSVIDESNYLHDIIIFDSSRLQEFHPSYVCNNSFANVANELTTYGIINITLDSIFEWLVNLAIDLTSDDITVYKHMMNVLPELDIPTNLANVLTDYILNIQIGINSIISEYTNGILNSADLKILNFDTTSNFYVIDHPDIVISDLGIRASLVVHIYKRR